MKNKMQGKAKAHKVKTILLISAGSIALALGAIGIALPVLPTTPFVLLAAMCFSISSDKMYQRLLRTRHFGPIIKNYKEHVGVPIKIKRDVLIFLWAMLILSSFLMRSTTAYAVLAIVGIGVTIHICAMKTQKKP